MRRHGGAFPSVACILAGVVGSRWHRRFRFLALSGSPPKPAENSDESDVAHNREDECIPIISHDSFPLLTQRQPGDMFKPRDGSIEFSDVMPVLFIEVLHDEVGVRN